jgi:sporulation protein YlmC with PRC-barrel domain
VSPRARKVRVADLVGSRIVDSDGRIIGLVVDLAVTDGPHYRLTEVLSGGWEWLDRLEVLRSFRYHLRGHPHAHRIPWNDVDTFDGSTVRLKTKG